MKSKLVWVSGFAIAMLLLNIVLIIYIWRDKKPLAIGEQKQTAKAYLAKALRLSDEQALRFDSLQQSHLIWMRSNSKEIDSLNTLFAATSKGMDSISVSKLRDSLRYPLEFPFILRHLQTHQHFSELRSLLNVEQKRTLDSIVKEAVGIAGLNIAPPSNVQSSIPISDFDSMFNK